MRRFEKGDRFWTIEWTKTAVTTCSGVIGTKGRTSTTSNKDEDALLLHVRKGITRKLAEGFTETTPTLWPLASPTGRALEDALAEDPDDRANHMAYADWLSEQPEEMLQRRAEFIRLHLALEDEQATSPQRRAMNKRVKELLKVHERDWLGLELAHFLLDRRCDDLTYGRTYFFERGEWTFRRGWLDTLRIDDLTPELATVLGQAPGARLLRSLTLGDTSTVDSAFTPLRRAKVLGNLRKVEIENFGIDLDLPGWLKKHAQLEELRLTAMGLEVGDLFRGKFPALRLIHLEETLDFPVKDIARNASLGNLRQLVLIPDLLDPDEQTVAIRLPEVRVLVESSHLTGLEELTIQRTDAGDAGVRAIIASGILKRLKVLNLDHGCITDAGAQMLAECPDLAHLTHLHLEDNRLTREGKALLRNRGPKVFLTDQQRPQDGVYLDDYLFASDDWE